MLPRVRNVAGGGSTGPALPLEGYGQLWARDGQPIGGKNAAHPSRELGSATRALKPRTGSGAGQRPAGRRTRFVINRGAARTGHLALGMTKPRC